MAGGAGLPSQGPGVAAVTQPGAGLRRTHRRGESDPLNLASGERTEGKVRPSAPAGEEQETPTLPLQGQPQREAGTALSARVMT